MPKSRLKEISEIMSDMRMYGKVLGRGYLDGDFTKRYVYSFWEGLLHEFNRGIFEATEGMAASDRPLIPETPLVR